jgi:TPR repeat protein
MRHGARILTAALYLALVPGSAVASEASDAARCQTLKGRPAVTACLAAIRAKPNAKALRRRLGFAYLEADLHSESIAAFREVTKRWPNDWQAHFDLAAIFNFLQAYPSAVAPIEAAMRLRPDNRKSLMSAALIYRNVRRDKAVYRVALRAARLGERVAMFMTSYHYEYGIGTKKDLAQARFWIEKAATAGHVGAMDQMTKGYLNGAMGFRPNARKAELWATRARVARNGR